MDLYGAGLLSQTHKEYDWLRTAYSGAKEGIPDDIPESKGKHVTTTIYIDANIMTKSVAEHHDQVSGRVATGCLRLVNATPSHWHAKKLQLKLQCLDLK